MDAEDTPQKGGGKAPKSKPSGPSKYKAMMKKPTADATDSIPDSTMGLSPDHPLMVEKKDGSVGQWGNDLPQPTKTPAPPIKKQMLSDKARNLSTSYSPARGQQQGPAIPEIKSNFKY